MTLHLADHAAAKKAPSRATACSTGVTIARDLVNEPPNVLTPANLPAAPERCEKLGVEVEVLDEKALKKIGMRALLGVGQGSEQESQVVIMRWNGAKNAKASPSPSSARAWCSIPAASRSSRRRAWRT
jgi:leucyl aminopeptidase